MLSVVAEVGNSALRLWVAAGLAALFVGICALAFGWTRARTAARLGVVVLGGTLGTTMALVFLDAASIHDRDAERRALEMRAADLNLRALAPNSPLACLDGLAGENVEAACEKAIFATPATVATATSYVAARLALLSDMVAFRDRSGSNIDNVLLPLRHSLEEDRFGFVAHALAARDRCTSQNCQALVMLHDPSRVRANLSGQTLDRYLDHYVAAWDKATDVPVADATSAQPQPTSASSPGGPLGQRKVVVNIDFPTAASIPPVSIMNPEPKGPLPPAVAADRATSASSSKRSRKQPGAPAAQSAASSGADSQGAVDPVWAPGAAAAAMPPAAVAPAPPAAAAAAPSKPNVAPAAAAPVQLDPFLSQPQASAGAAARTQ